MKSVRVPDSLLKLEQPLNSVMGVMEVDDTVARQLATASRIAIALQGECSQPVIQTDKTSVLERLYSEAVSNFAALGVNEDLATRSIMEKMTHTANPQALLASVVANQRLVREEGATAEIASRLGCKEMTL